MSQQDPTGIAGAGGEFWFGEVSVEDVAALNEIESGANDPTQSVIGANEIGPIVPFPPIRPIPIAKRAVSGRYRGTLGAFQLELRVDVDRTRPTNRLSGDFFQVSGGTTSYFGSFIVNTPTITVTATQVVVKGLGSFTFAAGAPVVQVTIQRRALFHSGFQNSKVTQENAMKPYSVDLLPLSFTRLKTAINPKPQQHSSFSPPMAPLGQPTFAPLNRSISARCALRPTASRMWLPPYLTATTQGRYPREALPVM